MLWSTTSSFTMALLNQQTNFFFPVLDWIIPLRVLFSSWEGGTCSTKWCLYGTLDGHAYREPKLLVDNDGAHASEDRGVLWSSHIRNQLQPGTNNLDLFGYFSFLCTWLSLHSWSGSLVSASSSGWSHLVFLCWSRNQPQDGSFQCSCQEDWHSLRMSRN